MCIGLPMQIIDVRPGLALCRYQGEASWIDMMLVGEQPVGTWVMVFLNTAREVINEQTAKQIADALTAVRQNTNRVTPITWTVIPS